MFSIFYCKRTCKFLQKLASTFTVKNTEHDDSIVIKYNCNFFEIENGKFSSITVYMQGENTLN